MKLMKEILSPRVFNGYSDERVKSAIFHMFISYYDISSSMGMPDDTVIDFVVNAFTSLTEDELDNPESRVVPLSLYCLYCILGVQSSRAKLRNMYAADTKLAEAFKRIHDSRQKPENKDKSKKIQVYLLPKKPVGPAPGQPA